MLQKLKDTKVTQAVADIEVWWWTMEDRMRQVNWEAVALGFVTVAGYAVIVWGMVAGWFN